MADTSWVSVTPIANSAYYPGIRNIPNNGSASVTVPLLLTSDIIYIPSLLSTQPLSIDPATAQVIVKVVDNTGSGISGAQVSNIGGQAMAYAKLGSWIDSLANTSTDSSGLVIAINVPARKTQGDFVAFTVVGPNAQGNSVAVAGSVPVLAGFVSYGTVQIQ